ncbi:DNA translocase FtsK, partial [Staphylococcus aureus]
MSEMNAVYNVKQYILNLIKQNKLEYGDQLPSNLSIARELNVKTDDVYEIGRAHEVTNVSYVVPPLTLLNQPAKQKATSKAEVQRQGQVLENTLKDFGVNAK